MSQENEFESLFAEFDSTVETTAPPSKPHARVRRAGLWGRFLRWVVQGPGLLLALYLLWLLPLVKEPERGLNLPGVLLLLWLVSGLLGKRPLAHPSRWLVLLLPSTLLLTLSAVLVRCGIDQVETRVAPVRHFTKSLLDLAEKATIPSTLAWQAFAAVALFALTRVWAKKLPWVDPSRATSRVRRTVSMLLLGLALGSLCALPLLYLFAWTRPWLASPAPVFEESYRDRVDSLPDDLGQRYPQVYSKNFQLEKNLTPQRKAALLRDAQQKLASDAELTRDDVRVLFTLLHLAQTAQTPSQELTELCWSAFARSARGGLPAAGVTNAFRRQVVPAIVNSPDPKLWRERLNSLPAAKVELETLDAIVADAVRREIARMSERKGRPLKLFGRDLRVGYSQVVYQAELTVKILLYQKQRKYLSSNPIDFRAPSLYRWPLSRSWNDVGRHLQDRLEQIDGSGNSIHLQDRRVAQDALSHRENVGSKAP